MMPMKRTKLICGKDLKERRFRKIKTSLVKVSQTEWGLTIMEASTGPFITHQMAALSFMSQQLRQQSDRTALSAA